MDKVQGSARWMIYAIAATILWIVSFHQQYGQLGMATAIMASVPVGALVASYVLLALGYRCDNSKVQKFICVAAIILSAKQALFAGASLCLAHDLALRHHWSAAQLQSFHHAALITAAIAILTFCAFIKVSKVGWSGEADGGIGPSVRRRSFSK